MDEEYLKVQQMGTRAIPGQSLTNDPENPAPFEKAPQYTSVHEASEAIFSELILKENYVPLMEAIATGTPVMEVVQVVLFSGFTQGKWNPDLLVMLIEPVAYMILALAERLDIDPIIYEGEEEDDDDDERSSGTKFEELALQKIDRNPKNIKVPSGVLTNEMIAKLESIPNETMESPEPVEQPMQQSLLAAT